MTDLTRDALLRAAEDAHRDAWDDAQEYAEAPRAVVDAVLRLLADMADQWNAQSDRESEAADRWGGYHAGARSARMDCERDLRSLLPEGVDRA